MERLSRAAALAFWALATCAARAEGEASWYVQIDNDVAFATDRWYSSGFRIARAHDIGDGKRLELGLVQELYTPEVERVASARIDRPYAGRLMLSAARHEHAEGFHRTLELNAGVRGPAALGPESQDAIHRVIPGPDTDWSRQLPERFDGQLVAAETREFARNEAQGALHYGAVVGTNVSFAHAGVELRTSGQRAVPGSALRFAATPPTARDGGRGWSAFAGASVRRIFRNTLLSRNEIPFGPPIERNDTILRIAAGVAWSSATWGALNFTLVQDSREFESQRTPHRFGILAFRLDFL